MHTAVAGFKIANTPTASILLPIISINRLHSIQATYTVSRRDKGIVRADFTCGKQTGRTGWANRIGKRALLGEERRGVLISGAPLQKSTMEWSAELVRHQSGLHPRTGFDQPNLRSSDEVIRELEGL